MIAARDDGTLWPGDKEVQTRVSHWLRDQARAEVAAAEGQRSLSYSVGPESPVHDRLDGSAKYRATTVGQLEGAKPKAVLFCDAASRVRQE